MFIHDVVRTQKKPQKTRQTKMTTDSSYTENMSGAADVVKRRRRANVAMNLDSPMVKVLKMPKRKEISKRNRQKLVSSLEIAQRTGKTHIATIKELLLLLAEIDGASEIKYGCGRVSEILIPEREFLIYATGLPREKSVEVLDWWHSLAV